MDYGRGGGAYPGSNAIEIIPASSAADLWATDDDYATSAAADDQPASKKSRGGEARAIGKMFFKTKLCCKFRAGTCPYVTTCNFAHNMEELRRPPPNWQEIVAAQEDTNTSREENQIPILTSSSAAIAGAPLPGERSYKGRHCKKFFTDEGCPYGDSCTFLHDEQSRARESVTISLSPSVGVGGGMGGGQGLKPSNWKTRMCNKWELSGFCPFGSKCHFAHGAAELHRYGGGLMDMDGRDASSAVPDSNPAGTSAMIPLDTVVASNAAVPHNMGVPAHMSVGISQRVGQKHLEKWKGPNKISRIYGDWIDEND